VKIYFNHSKELSPGTGTIILNPDFPDVTVTVHPNIKSVSLNEENILKHYEMTGRTSWNSLQEGIVSEIIFDDDYQAPCCVWFSPAEVHVKNGAEQVPNYPYSKNRKDGQCTNPIVTNSKDGFVRCPYYNSPAGMSACTTFKESDFFNHIVAIADQQEIFFVQKRFVKMRQPVYRIVEADSGNILDDNLTDYHEALAAALEMYPGTESHVLTDQHNSYLKAVLA